MIRSLTLIAALVLTLAFSWTTPVANATVLFDEGKRELEVDISELFPEQSRVQISQWIEHLAHSLTLVYGHWPRQRWAIDVEPVSGSIDDPIPWAQVHREKIDRVAFYVLSSASADTLKHEWTGYHEVAHLLLPYRGWGDTWFSEGLASYYQNLLQTRVGVLSEEQMWQKLYDGFARGKADDRFDGQTLLSVNQQMREKGGYMRVYWSGAWYFFAADISLRAKSNGEYSLDNALKQLNSCCAAQSLSVAEIIAHLDASTDQKMFSELYQKVYQSRKMPPYASLFAQLGIEIKNGQVSLVAGGANARRRREFLSSTVL